MKLLKKVIIIIAVVALLLSGGIIYLNRVFLPTRIKSLLIKTLQDYTRKNVEISSIRFNILKGLVVRGLVIRDDKKEYISINEGSCIFMPVPLFKKILIIPGIRIKNAQIYIERNKDGQIDWQELFREWPIKLADNMPWSVYIYKVNMVESSVHFKDNYFTEPFAKDFSNLRVLLSFSLPASIKFSIQSQIQAQNPADIKIAGEYAIIQNQIVAKALVNGLSLSEFRPYYNGAKFILNEDSNDISADLKYKDKVFSAKAQVSSKNFDSSWDNLSFLLNSQTYLEIEYNSRDKSLKYLGNARLDNSKIKGIDVIGEIAGLNGEVRFNNSGLSTSNIRAAIWNKPVEVKFVLDNFNNPIMEASVKSFLSGDSLNDILKGKFHFSFPGQLGGNVNLLFHTKNIPGQDNWQFSGYLDFVDTVVKYNKFPKPLDSIRGRLEFSNDTLKWDGINFNISGISYKTSGTLNNFSMPQVKAQVSSKDLFVNSAFQVDKNLVNLTSLSGRYLNSDFSASGSIDATDYVRPILNITGGIKINVEDLSGPFDKFRNTLERIKPSGIIHTKFNINGDSADFKKCNIGLKLSSEELVLYGLKVTGVIIDYTQDKGIVSIPIMRLSFYDGTIDAGFNMDLNSSGMPYSFSAGMQAVKIEKLKLDTKSKDKDIAGTVSAQIKGNGLASDLSKLSGEGNLSITEGKLWELNLFQGIGKLIFAKDFANIVFHDGSANFIINDRHLISNDVKLKSNIADLAGKADVGFDGSLDIALNIEILSEMIPLTGTFKDVATAIVGRAGRFGVIKISGTIKEPKYKFKTAVMDILKGIKDSIFHN